MHLKDKLSSRILTFLTICVFTANTLAWSVPSLPAVSLEGLKEEKQELSSIQNSRIPYVADLPSELGRVQQNFLPAPFSTDSVPGKPNLFVIHIQDAHANPEAQARIRDILSWLHEHVPASKDNELVTVALEGAAGPIHPEYFDLFSHFPEANEIFVQDLANKGEITGAELFAWEEFKKQKNQKGFNKLSISGVENPTLYRDNLQTYRELLFQQNEIQTALQPLQAQLEIAKSKILNPRLRDFLKEKERRKNDLGFYVAHHLIQQVLEVLGIDLKERVEQFRFPNLTRFFYFHQKESQIDQKAANSEWIKLRSELMKAGIEEEEIKKLNSFQENPQIADVSLRVIFENILMALKRKGEKVNFEKFPHYVEWIGFNLLSQEIESSAFFEEIERLEHAVEEKMAPSENERKFLKIYYDFILLEKLFHLELTRTEYRDLVMRKGIVHPQVIAQEIASLAGNKPSASKNDFFKAFFLRKDKDGNSLNEFFIRALGFYKGARERDRALLENALKLSSSKSRATHQAPRILVLITGGFHTEGLTELMKEKQIPYAVVMPRMTHIEENNLYHKVLLRENADLSPYFKNSWLNKQEALFFKGLVEQAIPALAGRYQVPSNELPVQFETAVRNHPVLKARLQTAIFPGQGQPFVRLNLKGDSAFLPASAQAVSEVLLTGGKYGQLSRFPSEDSLSNSPLETLAIDVSFKGNNGRAEVRSVPLTQIEVANVAIQTGPIPQELLPHTPQGSLPRSEVRSETAPPVVSDFRPNILNALSDQEKREYRRRITKNAEFDSIMEDEQHLGGRDFKQVLENADVIIGMPFYKENETPRPLIDDIKKVLDDPPFKDLNFVILMMGEADKVPSEAEEASGEDKYQPQATSSHALMKIFEPVVESLRYSQSVRKKYRNLDILKMMKPYQRDKDSPRDQFFRGKPWAVRGFIKAATQAKKGKGAHLVVLDSDLSMLEGKQSAGKLLRALLGPIVKEIGMDREGEKQIWKKELPLDGKETPADLVTLEARRKFRYDDGTVHFITYLLMKSFFGIDNREAHGGEFALSSEYMKKLVELPIWEIMAHDDVYCLECQLLKIAALERGKITEVQMNEKTHKGINPEEIAKRLTSVISVIFEDVSRFMSSREDWLSAFVRNEIPQQVPLEKWLRNERKEFAAGAIFDEEYGDDLIRITKMELNDTDKNVRDQFFGIGLQIYENILGKGWAMKLLPSSAIVNEVGLSPVELGYITARFADYYRKKEHTDQRSLLMKLYLPLVLLGTVHLRNFIVDGKLKEKDWEHTDQYIRGDYFKEFKEGLGEGFKAKSKSVKRSEVRTNNTDLFKELKTLPQYKFSVTAYPGGGGLILSQTSVSRGSAEHSIEFDGEDLSFQGVRFYHYGGNTRHKWMEYRIVFKGDGEVEMIVSAPFWFAKQELIPNAIEAVHYDSQDEKIYVIVSDDFLNSFEDFSREFSDKMLGRTFIAEDFKTDPVEFISQSAWIKHVAGQAPPARSEVRSLNQGQLKLADEAARVFGLSEVDKKYLIQLWRQFPPPAPKLKIGTDFGKGENFILSSVLSAENREKLLGAIEYSKLAADPKNTEKVKDIVATLNSMDGGVGESLKRAEWLLKRNPELAGKTEKEILGAKGTDLGWDFELQGQNIFVSIAEAKILQLIQLGEKKQYAGIYFQPLVNYQSIKSYETLLNSPYLFDRLDHKPQNRIYRDVLEENGVKLLPMLQQADLPSIEMESGNVALNPKAPRQPGGHGQWGVLFLYNSYKHPLPQDGKTHIRVFYNGDNVNSRVNENISGYMARNNIPIIKLTTAAMPIDKKGGKDGVRAVLVNGEFRYVPDQLEVADAKAAKQEELFYQAGQAGGIGEAGKQAFNTNIIYINDSVLHDILQELAQVFGGEDKIYEVISPSLIDKRDKAKMIDGKSYVALDGAIGSAIHNLNAFFQLSTDPKVKAILEKRGLQRLLYFVDIPRTEFFTPVKDAFQMWQQTYSDYYIFDKQEMRLKDRQKGLIPAEINLTEPNSDDPKKDNGYWLELQHLIDSFGHASTKHLRSLDIQGKVLLKDAVLIGNIEIINKTGHFVDLRDPKYKEPLKSLFQGEKLVLDSTNAKDNQLTVIFEKDGSVSLRSEVRNQEEVRKRLPELFTEARMADLRRKLDYQPGRVRAQTIPKNRQEAAFAILLNNNVFDADRKRLEQFRHFLEEAVESDLQKIYLPDFEQLRLALAGRYTTVTGVSFLEKDVIESANELAKGKMVENGLGHFEIQILKARLTSDGSIVLDIQDSDAIFTLRALLLESLEEALQKKLGGPLNETQLDQFEATLDTSGSISRGGVITIGRVVPKAKGSGPYIDDGTLREIDEAIEKINESLLDNPLYVGVSKLSFVQPSKEFLEDLTFQQERQILLKPTRGVDPYSTEVQRVYEHLKNEIKSERSFLDFEELLSRHKKGFLRALQIRLENLAQDWEAGKEDTSIAQWKRLLWSSRIRSLLWWLNDEQYLQLPGSSELALDEDKKSVKLQARARESYFMEKGVLYPYQIAQDAEDRYQKVIASFGTGVKIKTFVALPPNTGYEGSGILASAIVQALLTLRQNPQAEAVTVNSGLRIQTSSAGGSDNFDWALRQGMTLVHGTFYIKDQPPVVVQVERLGTHDIVFESLDLGKQEVLNENRREFPQSRSTDLLKYLKEGLMLAASLPSEQPVTPLSVAALGSVLEGLPEIAVYGGVNNIAATFGGGLLYTSNAPGDYLPQPEVIIGKDKFSDFESHLRLFNPGLRKETKGKISTKGRMVKRSLLIGMNKAETIRVMSELQNETKEMPGLIQRGQIQDLIQDINNVQNWTNMAVHTAKAIKNGSPKDASKTLNTFLEFLDHIEALYRLKTDEELAVLVQGAGPIGGVLFMATQRDVLDKIMEESLPDFEQKLKGLGVFDENNRPSFVPFELTERPMTSYERILKERLEGEDLSQFLTHAETLQDYVQEKLQPAGVHLETGAALGKNFQAWYQSLAVPPKQVDIEISRHAEEILLRFSAEGVKSPGYFAYLPVKPFAEAVSRSEARQPELKERTQQLLQNNIPTSEFQNQIAQLPMPAPIGNYNLEDIRKRYEKLGIVLETSETLAARFSPKNIFDSSEFLPALRLIQLTYASADAASGISNILSREEQQVITALINALQGTAGQTKAPKINSTVHVQLDQVAQQVLSRLAILLPVLAETGVSLRFNITGKTREEAEEKAGLLREGLSNLKESRLLKKDQVKVETVSDAKFPFASLPLERINGEIHSVLAKDESALSKVHYREGITRWKFDQEARGNADLLVADILTVITATALKKQFTDSYYVDYLSPKAAFPNLFSQAVEGITTYFKAQARLRIAA